MSIKLNEIKKGIKNGTLKDDDLKEIADTITERVQTGRSGVRVLSKAATAAKEFHKQRAVMKTKKQKKSFVVSLYGRLQRCSEDLQLLVDGSAPSDNGVEDRQHFEAIRQLMPGYVYRAHRLGIDVLKVYKTFVAPHLMEGKKDERG